MLPRTGAPGGPAPVAVVLGGGVNGLGVVRSLARAGIRPLLVTLGRDEAAASRYCRPVRASTFDGEPFVAELLRLRERLSRDAVLICADDRPLLTVSRHRDRLAPHFRFALPAHELLEALTRKLPFFRMARAGGFAVAETLLLQRHADLRRLHDLRPPLCVKPNGRSPDYDGAFAKAYRVAGRQEAQDLCRRILDRAGEVVVQEWIEGANDAICFVLCCLGAPAPVVFTGRKGRSWPAQVGTTASCWAAPEVAEELEAATLGFFRHAGVAEGLAGMEFKRDARDGRFYMVEPTVGRADGQEEIAALCGINLCHVAYCDAAGLPRPRLRLDPAHVWRDEFTDFRAARALGTACAYPPGHRIHNAFWRWHDPLPALRAAARRARNAARRLLGPRVSAPSAGA
ncbi:carboxylate--amine ligase [Caldovatus aquaticus]|uniref:ATP-grasp domain-containing protein n=1 Tax=Caldovatus aquaticus TaxID=2865671 RepID=A0ABS7F8F1_9PROT|nr:hypothetical protein [Caldovatus aquaticus]MBW8271101.1 hypothetical protein [Caldovatus aquaticus]